MRIGFQLHLPLEFNPSSQTVLFCKTEAFLQSPTQLKS